MTLLSCVVFSTLASLVLANPLLSSHALHEQRHQYDVEWTRLGRVEEFSFAPVRIGLTQSNLDEGPDLLNEVSDPASPRYGKYYTQDEIIDIFAPSPLAIEAVGQWLEAEGITRDRWSLSTNKQWIQFDAKYPELEQLLRTEFFYYENRYTAALHPACHEYYVPREIQHHIDYITPGIRLIDQRRRVPLKESEPSAHYFQHNTHRLPVTRSPINEPIDKILSEPLATSCGKLITPACIRALYNFSIGTTKHPGNQLGIFESLQDFYRQEDLNRFYTKFFPRVPNGTHPKLDSIDGGPEFPNASPSGAGLESNLDFEVAIPIVYPQKTIVYQADDEYSEIYYPGIFNNFLDAIDGSYCTYCAYGQCGNLKGFDAPYPDKHKGGYKGKHQCGKYKPTNVISISYSATEYFTPFNYQRRMCNEFLKLGMQGVSVLLASGDNGLASNHPALDNGCLFAHRDNHDFEESFDKTVANPGFPQTCPWLTVVGATTLPPGANVHNGVEKTTDTFASGGGFSNIEARPKYQNAAVEEYFKRAPNPGPSYNSHLNNSFAKNGGLFNRIGRAFPDVSANGENIATVSANTFSKAGGTSASAPLWAGLLTRINEERLRAGKTTIGFVNPVLYKNPHALHDLTKKGALLGCGGLIFNSTKGWDPAYGLGTPNFPKLLKLFMSLP